MNGNRITLAILFQGDHRLTLALFRSLSLGQKSGFSSICVLVLAGQLPVGFIHRLPGIFVILADFTIMFICVRIWMGVVCILLRSVFFFFIALPMHFLYPVYAPVSSSNANRDLPLATNGGSCTASKVIEPADAAMSLCLQSHIVGLPLSWFWADCNTLIKLNWWFGY